MEIKVIRRWFTSKSTIGELFINDEKQRTCFTLEDVRRPDGAKKVKGQTAIPPGRYEVVITYSNRFKRLMPLLLNVPGFEGIRIHSGNTDADTEGCLLVGELRGDDQVLESRLAYASLSGRLQVAANNQKIWLTIIEQPETA